MSGMGEAQPLQEELKRRENTTVLRDSSRTPFTGHTTKYPPDTKVSAFDGAGTERQVGEREGEKGKGGRECVCVCPTGLVAERAGVDGGPEGGEVAEAFRRDAIVRMEVVVA